MIESERDRRKAMWDSLLKFGGPNNISPTLLKDLRIYGGASGIWVDKKQTSSFTQDNHGVTVGLLHRGKHYPDSLSDIGITYHYPRTKRPPSRDVDEIESTKNVNRLSLPVFVITSAKSNSSQRDVHLGWIESWDDQNNTFQITFTEEPSKEIISQPENETPFTLTDNKTRPMGQVKVRLGQQRFSFRVFQRYGEECAVCDIKEIALLDAAHIRPIRDHGSDDPRNGLVLCAIHHRALDAGLFCINPDTLSICYHDKRADSTSLHITRENLHHLKNHPHRTALQWLWNQWNLT